MTILYSAGVISNKMKIIRKILIMKVKHFYLLNPIILSIVVSCNKNNDYNSITTEKNVNQIS